MKEIEILRHEEQGSLYDEKIGHYKISKQGMDDIVVIKNAEYRSIKRVEVSTMEGNKKFVVETLTNSEKYIVKPLDNLNSIAKKFNKSGEEIKSKNNLKTEKLFIGQIINI